MNQTIQVHREKRDRVTRTRRRRRPSARLEFKSADASRSLFVRIQLLHALALAYFIGSESIWPIPLSGVICLVAYWDLLSREFRLNRIVLSPMVLFLSSGIIRYGLVPLWVLACDLQSHDEAFYFARYNVRPWIIQGQFLLVLGDALFVLGYGLFQKLIPPRPLPRSLRRFQPGRTAYCTLAAISPFVVVNLVAPGLLSSLGRLGGYFTNYGLIAVIVLMLLSRRIGRPIPWGLISVVLILALMNSLRSYMKQSTIVMVLPLVLVGPQMILIQLRSYSKSLRHGVLVGGALVMVVGIAWLFSYSNIRRPDFWEGRVAISSSDVPVLPAATKATLSLFPWTEEFALLQRMPDQGGFAFFNRHADLFAAGWAFSDKEARGDNDGQFLRTVLISLVPRILWADKPQISQGRDVAVRLRQAASFDEATSSTHVGGMAPALFLDLGWPWLVSGMVLSGALFALIYHIFIPDILSNPFSCIVVVTLWVTAMRHFESAFAAGIEDYAYALIILLPLSKLWKYYFRNS